MLPFSSLSAFTAPAMMPMELKLANDTMKMERMPTVRGEARRQSCQIHHGHTNSLDPAWSP